MGSYNPTPADISIALKPNDIGAVPILAQEIKDGFDALAKGNGDNRQELLIKARSLVQALEAPRETMIKHCWAQTGAAAGLNLGVDTGLWKHMAKTDGPHKVEDLAAATGVEAALLSRLLRHLGAMGYVKETGVNQYQSTNFTKSMSIDIIGDSYLAVLGCTAAGPLHFHEYARKTGYKNPTDSSNTSMMHAYGTKMNMFSWLQSLGYGKHFNNHMGGYRQGRPSWCGPNFLPVQERLIDGADTAPDSAFIVDIGGSVGHDLAEFKNLNPGHPGKLILQDLPVVIGQIKDLDSSIVRMEHDFHTPQPVKGARAYYIHSCLHDWPDKDCQSILSSIKAAMKPGYSKLLINKNVILNEDAYWETSALDMVMLTLFCSRERTEADWYGLLEKQAGLKIVNIYSGGKGVESLIEVELP